MPAEGQYTIKLDNFTSVNFYETLGFCLRRKFLNIGNSYGLSTTYFRTVCSLSFPHNLTIQLIQMPCHQ